MFNIEKSYSSVRSKNLIDGGQFDRLKRHESLRNSAFYIESKLEASNAKYSSKKYVSCQNITRLNDRENEIIYEEDNYEDTEHSVKDKLVKRYNSLTNLLMRSFRKAKSKKKHETLQETEFELHGANYNPIQRQKTSGIEVSEQPPPSTSKYNSLRNNHFQASLKDDQEEKNDSLTEDEVDDSEPVFLGAKVISNEFVDLNVQGKPPNDRYKSTASERPKLMGKNNQNINVSTISLNTTEKASVQHQELKKLKYNSLDKTKTNLPLVESSQILKRFSCHTKPQAPRPPPAPKSTESLIYSTIKQVDQTNEPLKSTGLSIKRSKTFTEQMQDMLKVHKSAIPLEANNDERSLEKLVKQHQKKLINSVGDYTKFDDYKLSKSQPGDAVGTIIGLSNSSSTLTMSDTLKNVTNEIKVDDEDMKELISVLARQEDTFKKRFFDCLMTKLWDPRLPLQEYLQLNKLMKALFGETYHKIEANNASLPSRKTSKIDYLNFSSTKNSRTDAEHIVNLMRAYLDTKSNSQRAQYISTKHIPVDKNYQSVDNLLNTLRVRQKEEVALAKENNKSGRQASLVLKLEHGKEEEDTYDTYFDAESLYSSPPNTVNDASIHNGRALKELVRSEKLRQSIGHFEKLNQTKTATKHPQISSGSIKSSGIIASFQPHFSSSTHLKQDVKTTKWANSLVRNVTLASCEDHMIYSEKSACFTKVKPGMQPPPRPKLLNKTSEQENFQKSTKIKSLLDIFKNINENSKSFTNSKISLDADRYNDIKCSYRKFDSEIFYNRENKVRTNLTNAIFSPAKSIECEENNKNLIKLRLEEFNRFKKQQQVNLRQSFDVDKPLTLTKTHMKISDLIAEKIYKFEKKEMQQAYY